MFLVFVCVLVDFKFLGDLVRILLWVCVILNGLEVWNSGSLRFLSLVV